MAAPDFSAGEFEKWLNERLDGLGADREVYGAYILGVLQEEESDEEKSDALSGILSAFVDEDTLKEVCEQILKQWTDCCSRTAATSNQPEDEVQAIASLIEKQAQIVVKQKEVSEEAKRRKEALLAQYANVTDEEDEVEDEEEAAGAVGIPSDKSLFKNTNVEDVMNRRRQQREQAKEDAQKKKEQDKMQREKEKLTKQERKDREKKRTQKGERKR
ncbi:coiled-coil domain-containing protein 43 [Pangasianodon hypophthalmus]|uniref:coiled-coil domain-containing protein 43 n=1 Tax=Pangasianodon hypophthalmus TaxID=310915 RepID=UPI002307514D|nr:coiled-coil domain-containing protein 43 [Pangasianodon hypophthalmus]